MRDTLPTTIWRVYLVESGGWRDLGVDFTSRAAALAAKDGFTESFPGNRYVARRVQIREPNP